MLKLPKQRFFLGLLFMLSFSVMVLAETVVTPTGSVNFRQQPNGREIGVVTPGDKLVVIGEKGGWYLVRTEDGKRGYVFKRYMRQIESAPAAEETAAATAVAPDRASPQTVVTTGSVNFRASPNGRRIGSFETGTPLTLLGETTGWYKVQDADGNEGYVFKKFARPKETNETLEAQTCVDCEVKAHHPEPAAEFVEAITEIQDKVDEEMGRGAKCVSDRILAQFKKSTYRHRSKGRGKCQVAMRKIVAAAGIYPGGSFGHAKDTVPGYESMGFENQIEKYPTPDSAPEGAILIYGAPKNKKGCRGLGTKYGHIEFKESNNSYWYDGNPKYNIQEAYGARCRPLKAVMLMGETCKTCKRSVKNACGV